MDLNDAQLFFEDCNAFEQEYENMFFEAKQFFYTRVVIPSVFKSKRDKLQKQFQAYCLLSGVPFETCAENDGLKNVEFSGSIRDVVGQFNQARSAIKQELVMCKDFKSLDCTVRRYMKMYSDFVLLWPVEMEVGGVRIGAEPDPMTLLNGLQEAENEGVVSFEHLKRLSEEHPLRLEAKRLTLWRNKFTDGI